MFFFCANCGVRQIPGSLVCYACGRYPWLPEGSEPEVDSGDSYQAAEVPLQPFWNVRPTLQMGSEAARPIQPLPSFPMGSGSGGLFDSPHPPSEQSQDEVPFDGAIVPMPLLRSVESEEPDMRQAGAIDAETYSLVFQTLAIVEASPTGLIPPSPDDEWYKDLTGKIHLHKPGFVRLKRFGMHGTCQQCKGKHPTGDCQLAQHFFEAWKWQSTPGARCDKLRCRSPKGHTTQQCGKGEFRDVPSDWPLPPHLQLFERLWPRCERRQPLPMGFYHPDEREKPPGWPRQPLQYLNGLHCGYSDRVNGPLWSIDNAVALCGNQQPPDPEAELYRKDRQAFKALRTQSRAQARLVPLPFKGSSDRWQAKLRDDGAFPRRETGFDLDSEAAVNDVAFDVWFAPNPDSQIKRPFDLWVGMFGLQVTAVKADAYQRWLMAKDDDMIASAERILSEVMSRKYKRLVQSNNQAVQALLDVVRNECRIMVDTPFLEYTDGEYSRIRDALELAFDALDHQITLTRQRFLTSVCTSLPLSDYLEHCVREDYLSPQLAQRMADHVCGCHFLGRSDRSSGLTRLAYPEVFLDNLEPSRKGLATQKQKSREQAAS